MLEFLTLKYNLLTNHMQQNLPYVKTNKNKSASSKSICSGDKGKTFEENIFNLFFMNNPVNACYDSFINKDRIYYMSRLRLNKPNTQICHLVKNTEKQIQFENKKFKIKFDEEQKLICDGVQYEITGNSMVNLGDNYSFQIEKVNDQEISLVFIFIDKSGNIIFFNFFRNRNFQILRFFFYLQI